jgi:hypothetical protein
MKESRRWCTPERSPYTNKKVIASMSNEFNMDYSIIPEHIKQIFIEEKI